MKKSGDCVVRIESIVEALCNDLYKTDDEYKSGHCRYSDEYGCHIVSVVYCSILNKNLFRIRGLMFFPPPFPITCKQMYDGLGIVSKCMGIHVHVIIGRQVPFDWIVR